MFLYPWAFLGLFSIAVLAAIYWLQRHFRKRTVSSLFLWAEHSIPKQGGLLRRRLRTPLLFWLELSALALLTLAAAAPQFRLGENRRPLAVVLDDSFSMLAGGEDSPRRRAQEALEEELQNGAYSPIHLILAAERPQSLTEPIRQEGQLAEALQRWRCHAPSADLDAALALARRLGGPLARLLVLTDHAPENSQEPSRYLYWAFGRPLPNLAFVNAARSSLDGRERCLLEVANLGRSPSTAHLSLGEGDSSTTSQIELGPGEMRRSILELPDSQEVLRARLEDDALEIDNSVTLLPEGRPLVRVQVEIQDQELRELVETSLQAGRTSIPVDDRPQMVFTDREGDWPGAWTVRIFSEADARPYVGPFVIDRNHPLASGLSLEGTVWGAAAAGRLPGSPVISAGDVTLLSVQERLEGNRVSLRLRPSLSNLQRSPDWPILIWNMVDWRAGEATGMRRTNLRTSEQAFARLETASSMPQEAQVTFPDGTALRLPVQRGQVEVRADQAGIYRIEANGSDFRFAANALRREESDLSAASSGRWGERFDETAQRWEYRNVSWIFLLIALAVLGAHGFLAWGRA